MRLLLALLLVFRVARAEKSRIIGGTISQPNKWPFMVAIFLQGSQYCGGVVWNSHHILTAAHCLFYNGKAMSASDYKVVLGHSDISKYDSKYAFDVDQVIGHRDYEPNSMRNDIALMRLSRKIDMESSNFVSCVCDPVPLEQVDTSQCIALGWGFTEESNPASSSAQLRQVNLPILEDQYCSQKDNSFNTHWNVCAGHVAGGKDACQGDSGSPLVCQMKADSKQYALVGIVSYGIGCARPGSPGYYTRVSRFLGWIEAHSGEAS